MIRALLLALTLAAAVAPGPAYAVRPDEMLADPGLEARAREVGRELRCLVCRNQSIDDSDAELAHDLRVVVRERIKGGDSNDQVVAYVRARYGDFVLLKPRFTSHTALLWLMPAAVFVIGALALVLVSRRYRSRTALAVNAPAKLTAAEQARLSDLLRRGEP